LLAARYHDFRGEPPYQTIGQYFSPPPLDRADTGKIAVAFI